MVRSRSGLCTRWTNQLRGGSFTGSWTHGGPIYFPMATLRTSDGLAKDKDKGWVGEDEGWVDGVPSLCSA